MKLLHAFNLKRVALFCLLFLGISFSANASHYSGGELTFSYTGPNQYLVTFTVYRDCNGVSVGPTQIVNYSSAACGVNASIILNLQSTTEVTPLCPTEPSACGGGGSLGIQLLVFQGTLTLPPGCTDWVLSTESCCRNSAITNLTSPGNQSIYIEAHLDNTTGGNSSPSFSSPPQFFGCVGQTINFQQLAFDADGDVLVYSLISGMQTAATNVNYAGGFSGVNPFTVPLVLDPTTGQITFTPNVAQVAVVTILIEEYRNGVLIGSIMRDIQFVIRNCNNNLPLVSGINNVPGVYEVTICQGTSICFDIFGTDPDVGQNLSLSYAGSIPGAIFTQTGTVVSPSGTFCWSSGTNPSGDYSFSITAEDDACPLIGQNSILFTIHVVPNPNDPVNAGPDLSICAGETVTLNATTTSVNGVSYDWTPVTDLSTPNVATTDASPITTTSYTVTLTYTDGCSSQDAVTITVLSDPSANAFPSTADVCGGSGFLLSGTTNQVGMQFEWFDPSMVALGSGTVSGSQSTMNISVPNASGTYPYILVVTNPLTGCQSSDTTFLTVGAPPALPSCVNIYVSTTGTIASAGTQADPTSLEEGMARAACNDAIIKIATGTYNIDNPLTIGSYVTMEGGFQEGSAWTKVSTPGATTINRTTANSEGALNAQRLVAFYANGSTGFRLQDLTITTANANLPGMSTYGLHLTACSDYNIVRCQVISGAAAQGGTGFAGANGLNGANGNTGQAGDNDDDNSGGGGGNGGVGAGGAAGGLGGAGNSTNAFNGSAGVIAIGINGGGGGGGGSGGGEDTDGGFGGNGAGALGVGGLPGQESGCNGSVNCGSSESGTNGQNAANGTNGTTGVTGPSGSHLGGFWVPGGTGGSGTNGTGGAGGGGGGGGAGEGGFFCIDGHGSGGGGGGGGGQAGTGGFGGLGGGSSYPAYLYLNGTNGIILNSNFTAGPVGVGGNGGNGGAGGTGGTGGNGSNYTGSEVGCGGDGGSGGSGGIGGPGGNGASGQTQQIYFGGGAVLTTNDANFNLAAQPVITASNVNCVDTDVNFVTPAAATWNFTANATPQSPTGVSVITQFNVIDRYDIIAGVNTYAGFHNVAFGSIDPEIVSNAPTLGVDTFVVCQGDFASFESLYYADIYTWDFDGAIPNPGNQQVVSSQFNTPGFYEILMNMTTDCCGLSPNDTVYLYVVPVSSSIGSGDLTICEGESAVLSLMGLTATDSIVWSPLTNSVPVVTGSISVNPITTTTYTASVYSSITGGGQTIVSCPVSVSFTVTVNPLPNFTLSSSPVLCSNDGTATATTSNPGIFNFVWDNGSTTNATTSSTIVGLAVGNYAVTVTDAVSGCSVSDSIDVLPSATTPIVYVQLLTGTCEGENDGTVTVATSGGTGPYTYSWSDIGVGPASRTLMPAGIYTVTVTDALGCSSSITFDIPEFENADVNVTPNGPICSGDSAYFIIEGHDASTLTYNFGGANSTLFFTSDTMYLTVLNVTSDLTMYLVSIDNGTCIEFLTDTEIVVVLPLPTVAITTNSPICTGNDAIFTLTGTPGAIVSYSIGGGALTTTTLVGGTADVTIVGAITEVTIVLDSINDGACPQLSGATDTITVNPVISVIQSVEACENDTYTYPDGVSEVILVNTIHVSNLITVAGCDSTVTTNVTMNPEFNIVSNIDVCENESHTYPDGFVEVIIASTAHTSNLTTANGCDSVIVTNITMLPIYSTIQNISICEGDAYTFPDGTVHDPILVDETYSSVFASANGCDSTIVTNLTVNLVPIINAGLDESLCEGESTILTALNPSGAIIVWNNGIIDGVSFTPAATTICTVNATSVDGCISSDDVLITVNPNPVAAFSADVLDGCDPLSVVFTNISTGASTLCEWDFGDGQTGTGCGSVDHIYGNAGLYTVSLNITDANGCTDDVTYTDYISVYEQPTAEFTFGSGFDVLDSEVQFENQSIDATSYVWDFGDASATSTVTDPFHSFPDGGSAAYTVILIANNGVCADTIQYIVQIEDVLIYYIPNTFTPDGNSVNQTFQAVFTSGYDPYDFELLIFNRWGVVIFESRDVTIGWDGTYKGVLVQDGTYTWKVEFKELMSDKRHVDTGHVNMIR